MDLKDAYFQFFMCQSHQDQLKAHFVWVGKYYNFQSLSSTYHNQWLGLVPDNYILFMHVPTRSHHYIFLGWIGEHTEIHVNASPAI